MEKRTKKKASAVAIAAAAILILAGTMAYLADASGILRNQWDPNHVEVDIAETGITKDEGKKDYTIMPGATDDKDPKITVDTDTDAYVFAAVKDNINNNADGIKYVDYDIADGWIKLTPADMQSKTIQKYLKTFAEHKTAGSVTIDPQDANTKIYYRVVHGTNAKHDFGPFSVLKDDQVHYPSTLTNADLDKLAALTDDQKQLTFATYAIQMDPFCDPAETEEAKIAAGAKDAWNQQGPVEKITVTQADGKTEVKVGDTLPLTATVEPETAKDKTVTWSSSDTDIATVDENGVVTGVAAGTVTITATANDGSGVKGTYELTVTGPTFGHAVKLYSINNDGTVTFMSALGINAVDEGVTCGNEHCIHNDSWEEIKAHPKNYAGCITNGCTKKITLDEDSFTEGAVKTYGDGGNILYDGFTEDELKHSISGQNSEKSYRTTLNKVKENSDIPDNSVLELLTLEQLGNPQSYHNYPELNAYTNDGSAIQYWTAYPEPGSTTHVFAVYGNTRPAGIDFHHNYGYVASNSTNIGIAFSVTY